VAAALDHAKLSDGPGGGCEMVPGTRHLKMNMYIAVSKGGQYKVVDSSKMVVPGECT
jgi:branched-chain amino acid transport system substrate-binding protein